MRPALQANGVQASFQCLVAGEALMNDGTALVLVKIFWALSNGSADAPLSGGEGVGRFLILAGGGAAFGALCGLVTFGLISLVRKARLHPGESVSTQVQSCDTRETRVGHT